VPNYEILKKNLILIWKKRKNLTFAQSKCTLSKNK